MNFSLQLRRNASSNLDLEKSRNRIELDRRISKYEDNCEYKNCPLQVHILKGTKTLNVLQSYEVQRIFTDSVYFLLKAKTIL